MSNGYLRYIELLSHKLAANSFNSLELSRYPLADFPSELEETLALTVEAYAYGDHPFSGDKVEVVGDVEPVRTLGLVLITRAVSAPVPAMRIRLETDLEVNLIYLEPIQAPLDFYDCMPKRLEYRFCQAFYELSREGRIVEDADRPGFGYLAQQDRVERFSRELSDWTGSALLIEGTANSALRLGSILLDLTHPSLQGRGMIQLFRRSDGICAQTYSLDCELVLTETAKEIYPPRC